ncbi:kinase-like domain-containing protein [Mycena crocata]|nr:kinase-like domain-containing protein [Mycena crocata]
MCAPNPIIGVIRSPEYRKTLLQLAHNIDLTNDPRLREALRKDERRLQTTLVIVLQSQDHAGRAQTLRGNDAQNFMDVAQNMLRKDIPQENCAMARRIIRRLSEACNTLPSSIFITGVTNCDNHYSFGGGYADIYRASYKGQPVALKRLREHIQGEDPQIVRLKFCREALVWQNLKSPYVLSLIGIDSNTFSPSLCMVSPWMGGGTMLNHLNENGRGNVNKLLSEVAQGLLYLHSQNVVHGDLRGENILITPDWTACLTDFGLSLFSDLSGRPTTMGGNIRWMAPELIAPERFGLPFARTTASDVYAFGCVCIELYTDSLPWFRVSDISDPYPDRHPAISRVAGVDQFGWAGRSIHNLHLKGSPARIMFGDPDLPQVPQHDHLDAIPPVSEPVYMYQLAFKLGVADNDGLRQAMREDQLYISEQITAVMESPESINSVRALEGDDAEQLLNLVHTILRGEFFKTQKHRSGAHQLVCILSEGCDKLPASIYVKGVTNCEKEPVFGGGYADVFRALLNGKLVALKRLRVNIPGESARSTRLKFYREALIWQGLDNPHVLPFFGIDRDTFSPTMCMVSPWMRQGTILTYLKETGRTDINQLLLEVTKGLHYLHCQGIVHGDLRGHNIVVTPDLKACLIDFGLSWASDTSKLPSNQRGSIRWMAPELLEPENFHIEFCPTKASDIYAFGSLTVELYTLQHPFSRIFSEATVMWEVINGNRPERPTENPLMSNDLFDSVTASMERVAAEPPPIEPGPSAISDISDTDQDQPGREGGEEGWISAPSSLESQGIYNASYDPFPGPPFLANDDTGWQYKPGDGHANTFDADGPDWLDLHPSRNPQGQWSTTDWKSMTEMDGYADMANTILGSIDNLSLDSIDRHGTTLKENNLPATQLHTHPVIDDQVTIIHPP